MSQSALATPESAGEASDTVPWRRRSHARARAMRTSGSRGSWSRTKRASASVTMASATFAYSQPHASLISP